MSKKKIKLGILSIFLFTLIFTTYNTVHAAGYSCQTTCAVTKNTEGKYIATATESKTDLFVQADPEKCIKSVGDCSKNTKGKKQCCEELKLTEYKAIYGDYNTQDILTRVIEVSNILLGVVGSVALLFFIIAGIKMIFSGGSEEKIGSARTMMVQTIVGLVIFLGAYLIVSFVQTTLMDESADSERYQLKEKVTPGDFK